MGDNSWEKINLSDIIYRPGLEEQEKIKMSVTVEIENIPTKNANTNMVAKKVQQKQNELDKLSYTELERMVDKAKQLICDKNFDIAIQEFEKIKKSTRFVGIIEKCEYYLKEIFKRIEKNKQDEANRREANKFIEQALILEKDKKYQDSKLLFQQAKSLCNDNDIITKCEIELEFIDIEIAVDNKSYKDLLSKLEKINIERVSIERKNKICYYKELCKVHLGIKKIYDDMFFPSRKKLVKEITKLKYTLKYQELTKICDNEIVDVHEYYNKKEAAEEYERLVNVYNSGIEYMSLGDYDYAIRKFEEAASMSKDNSFKKDCVNVIKECKEKRNEDRKNKAIEKYEQGQWYYRLGEYQRALWEFQEALKLFNDRDDRRDCEEMIAHCKNELNY